jgi:hypothetical protein
VSTPRTDAQRKSEETEGWSYRFLKMADHAELIETELAEANEHLAKAGAGPFKGDYYLGRVTETGAMRYQISNLQGRVHQAETELATLTASHERMAKVLSSMVSQCKRYLEERPTPMSELYSEEPTLLDKANAALTLARNLNQAAK